MKNENANSRQESGLCNNSHARYLAKHFTQIYKALCTHDSSLWELIKIEVICIVRQRMLV